MKRQAFQPNPSLARSAPRSAPVAVLLPGVAAGRRSVAVAVRLRSPARVRPVKPARCDADPAGTPAAESLLRVVTLARDPVHSSAFATTPPPDTGHAPSRLLSRGVPLPVRATARPGRATQVLPFSRRPTALLGFRDPFAGLLPPAGGRASRATRRNGEVDAPHRYGRRAPHLARHFCRSGPTCRSCRSSAPIDFRRGDRAPVEKTEICKSARPGMRWRRLLGFSSRLRSASSAERVAGDRSCLGLRLLQGWRALAVHRPGSTPRPIIGPRNRRGPFVRPVTIPIRSWVYRRAVGSPALSRR